MVGLLILGLGLLAGASIAVRYNVLREPPTSVDVAQTRTQPVCPRSADLRLHLARVALDHVRWRPTSIGSVLTLGGFIAYVVSMIPVLQEMSWRPWLERISIFKAYNPVELVTTGETFQFNLMVLSGIGFRRASRWHFVAFAVRDLPTNG